MVYFPYLGMLMTIFSYSVFLIQQREENQIEQDEIYNTLFPMGFCAYFL